METVQQGDSSFKSLWVDGWRAIGDALDRAGPAHTV